MKIGNLYIKFTLIEASPTMHTTGRWDLHLSGVAMQFSAVGDSAIFIHFLDSAQAWETNKPQKTYSDHNIHSF